MCTYTNLLLCLLPQTGKKQSVKTPFIILHPFFEPFCDKKRAGLPKFGALHNFSPHVLCNFHKFFFGNITVYCKDIFAVIENNAAITGIGTVVNARGAIDRN